MSANTSRGYLTKEVTVWCGICSEWNQKPAPIRQAHKHWKAEGWTFTRTYGWRCPKCSTPRCEDTFEEHKCHLAVDHDGVHSDGEAEWGECPGHPVED